MRCNKEWKREETNGRRVENRNEREKNKMGQGKKGKRWKKKEGWRRLRERKNSRD